MKPCLKNRSKIKGFSDKAKFVANRSLLEIKEIVRVCVYTCTPVNIMEAKSLCWQFLGSVTRLTVQQAL